MPALHCPLHAMVVIFPLLVDAGHELVQLMFAEVTLLTLADNGGGDDAGSPLRTWELDNTRPNPTSASLSNFDGLSVNGLQVTSPTRDVVRSRVHRAPLQRVDPNSSSCDVNEQTPGWPMQKSRWVHTPPPPPAGEGRNCSQGGLSANSL